MKKGRKTRLQKLIFLVSCAAFITVFALLLHYFFGYDPPELPANLRVSLYTLRWNKVDGAEFYEVSVGDRTEQVADNVYFLSFSDNGAQVRVRAKARGGFSEYTEPLTVNYPDDIWEKVQKVAYIADKIDCSDVEFNYPDTPIPLPDLTDNAFRNGYTFNGWTSGGEFVKEPFVKAGNVRLYAALNPIEYRIEYDFGIYQFLKDKFVGLPATYNVDNYDDIFAPDKYVWKGHSISSWDILSNPLKAEDTGKIIGDIIVRPRYIDTVTKGLVIDEKDGLYELSEYFGKFQTDIRIPYYPNITVKSNVLDLTEVLISDKVKLTFYAENVSLELSAVKLFNPSDIVFEGNLKAVANSIRIESDEPTSITLWGEVPDCRFVGGMLDTSDSTSGRLDEKNLTFRVLPEYEDIIRKNYPLSHVEILSPANKPN